MKLGTYTFSIQRTMQVRIQIVNEATFRLDYENWKKDEPDDDSEAAYLQFIALSIHQGENPVIRGTLFGIGDDDLVVEQVRACRHCGCTEHHGCVTTDEHNRPVSICSWVSEDLCSNPECLKKAAAEAEKDVANG